jgi:hypothetical protein
MLVIVAPRMMFVVVGPPMVALIANRGRHMPAPEERLRQLLPQIRCERRSLVGGMHELHEHNYSEFLTLTLGKESILIHSTG